jgi:nuclear pore complex protein Nup93
MCGRNDARLEVPSTKLGMPTIHTEVDAILQLRFMKKDRWTLSGLDLKIDPKAPFWAHLFTLVRMGMNDDALAYINAHSAQLSNKDKYLKSYFEAWMKADDGRLPRELQGTSD